MDVPWRRDHIPRLTIEKRGLQQKPPLKERGLPSVREFERAKIREGYGIRNLARLVFSWRELWGGWILWLDTVATDLAMMISESFC